MRTTLLVSLVTVACVLCSTTVRAERRETPDSRPLASSGRSFGNRAVLNPARLKMLQRVLRRWTASGAPMGAPSVGQGTSTRPDARPGKQAQSQLQREVSRIRSSADWGRLTEQQRKAVLSNQWLYSAANGGCLRSSGCVALGSFRSRRMADFAGTMAGKLERAVASDPVDDGFRKVGSLARKAEIFYLPSGEIVGGQVTLRQNARSCDGTFDCAYEVKGTFGAKPGAGQRWLYRPQPVEVSVGAWEFDH